MKGCLNRIANLLGKAVNHAPEAISERFSIVFMLIGVVWAFVARGSVWRPVTAALVALVGLFGVYWHWWRPDISGVLLKTEDGGAPCTGIPVGCVFEGETCSELVGSSNDIGEFKFTRWFGRGAYLLAIDIDESKQTAGLTEYFVNGFNERVNVKLYFPARKVNVRILETLSFNNGSSSLLVENGSYANLEKTLRKMESNPDLDLVLGGHASRCGDPSPNFKLSSARLDIVSRWLVGQGIDSSRIICLNYGEEHPINENDDGKNPSSTAARQNRVVTQVLIPRSTEHRKFLSVCHESSDYSRGVNDLLRGGICGRSDRGELIASKARCLADVVIWSREPACRVKPALPFVPRLNPVLFGSAPAK